jgi:hypothetical protein
MSTPDDPYCDAAGAARRSAGWPGASWHPHARRRRSDASHTSLGGRGGKGPGGSAAVSRAGNLARDEVGVGASGSGAALASGLAGRSLRHECSIRQSAPGRQATVASGGAVPAGRNDALVAIGEGREAGTSLDRRLESLCRGYHGGGGQQFLFAFPGDCLASRGPSSGRSRRAGLRTMPGRSPDVDLPALERA